jgi:acetyl-CoA C-acetyltransferase
MLSSTPLCGEAAAWMVDSGRIATGRDRVREVFVVSAVRTPLARRGGGLAGVHPADLLAAVQRAAVERAGIDPRHVDQVLAGCVSQVGEQAFNVARTAWLAAGCP